MKELERNKDFSLALRSIFRVTKSPERDIFRPELILGCSILSCNHESLVSFYLKDP